MAQLLTCPHGHPVRAGAKFCPTCGQQLTSRPGQVVRLTPSLSGTQRLSTSPRLRVRIPGRPPNELMLSRAPLLIGRDPGNNIEVPLPEVSRQHAQVIPSGTGYTVEDLNSANGTYLRGRKISPRQQVSLANGDVVRIGDRAGNSVSLTYLEATSPVPLAGRIDLGQAQLGTRPRLTIGRDPGCDITINSPVVSWLHVEVVRVGNVHRLNDLGSTNGTFVNGKLVRSVLLQPSDEVQIGPYKLVYSPTGFQQYSNVGSVRLDGIRLHKEVPGDHGVKVILNDVSLTVMPREFIALVGTSGAGKSTLLDALNGFQRAHSGRVLFNGDDLYRNYNAYRSDLGYVPQSDILHIGLPVQRALRYTALLRLSQDTTLEAVDRRVEDVLRQVDMLPQMDQSISKLSGGQRKRISIASELLSDPSLFFLDEPTSGLDPGLDKKMMFTLNTLADNGRTIVMTTHATSNIVQCDHVAFMAHGRLVYFGPPDQAITFFQAIDFPDIYSKMETSQDAQQWETRYKASPAYQQYVAGRQARVQQSPSGSALGGRVGLAKFDLKAFSRQFGILAWRYVDLIINDKLSMFTLLAVMPIIGLLLLLIASAKSLVGDSLSEIEQILEDQFFYSIVTDAQKILFIMALSAILLGVFAAAYEIIKEKRVYQRERMVNLGIGAYLASKVVVLMGFGLLQCAALLIVVSLKINLPTEGVFLPAPIEIYLTLVLAMLAGVAAGLMISTLVKNSNMVIYLVLVVLFLQIIFSGVMFEMPGFAGSLSAFTSTRWALEGLGASVNMDALNDLSQQYIEVIDGIPVYKTIDVPVDFNINYDRSAGHLLGTWFMQLLFTVVFIGLTVWALKRQDVQT